MFNVKSLRHLNDMLSDENGRKILDHPKLKALLASNEFHQAVEGRDMNEILSNPDFQKLIEDPEFRDLTRQFKKKKNSGSSGTN